MHILPTGIQYELAHGDHTAVVTEMGATLRSLAWRGKEMLWTFEPDEKPVGFAGATLVPWPNRIRDGRYVFDGEEFQLSLSEPRFHNAIHGLAAWTPWRLTSRHDDELTLGTIVHPQPGWPGTLRCEVSYALDDDGLRVTHRAFNAGDVDLPFGYGAHPIFAFDDLTDVTLSLPFERELRVDDRLLPTELDGVNGERDFRQPHALGETTFDTAFTDPVGHWEVRAEGPSHAVTVWADESFDWVQIFTRPERNGLAIEPMTCGPDAFNDGPTHGDVIRLSPGDVASGTWGVRFG